MRNYTKVCMVFLSAVTQSHGEHEEDIKDRQKERKEAYLQEKLTFLCCGCFCL